MEIMHLTKILPWYSESLVVFNCEVVGICCGSSQLLLSLNELHAVIALCFES